MNTAVRADGTLYVAIKTGYSSAPLPTIGLFVRRPNGTWDNLYFVDTVGTRPIVVLDEETNKIRVFYTSTTGTAFMRESSASVISFGPIEEVISGGFNDMTSVKDSWTGRLLVLTSSLAGTTGVVMQPDPGLVGHFKMDENGGTRLVDISGYGNDADIVGSPVWTPGVKKLALDLDGGTHAVVSDQAQLNPTNGLTISAWIQPVAQTDQEIVNRAGAGIDGYTLGLSSSSSPNPGTVFFHLNQATFGDAFRLSSLSQYPHRRIHLDARRRHLRRLDDAHVYQRRRGKLDARPGVDRQRRRRLRDWRPPRRHAPIQGHARRRQGLQQGPDADRNRRCDGIGAATSGPLDYQDRLRHEGQPRRPDHLCD
jgi:hypothetical protein